MGLFNFLNKSQTKETAPPPKPKVLIVEDDAYLLDFYKELLEGEGYEITTAINGKEALSIAQQLLPQVIILDVMMPVMDGMQVLEALKKSDIMKKIPVIMLTNAGNIENMETAKYHKAFRFLIKSNIPPEVIIQTTKDALSYNSAITS
jgi:CheY-like chemotaxis protein